MKTTHFLLALTAVLSLASPATAQLGGLLRNAEPYLALELSYGTLYGEESGDGDMRIAWGNDYEDMKWEFGLSVLGNKGADGDDVRVLDLTMLSETRTAAVEIDWGIALELRDGDYGGASGAGLGAALMVEVSLADTPEPWDPYVIARGRMESWDVGFGVRWRY